MIINAVIAEEVAKRLGQPIRQEKVAQMRRDMGLGNQAMIERDMLRKLAGLVKISPSTAEYNLADLALLMTVTCMRNTVLESYHAGRSVTTRTGDYSDVKVVTPDGEIPCSEVSRITGEMKAFNIEVRS